MRQKIFDLLKGLRPTFFVGQHKGKCKDIYFVIKFGEQSLSIANSSGAFEYFEVMVYVPSNSVKGLDENLKEIKDALKNIAEPTGRITPDFLDEEVEAIMRSIQFKIAKEA